MIKISESAALAIHTVALLARHPKRRFSNKEISGLLKCSVNTLSKVLQRLTKAKIIKSVRGPSGGFSMIGDPETTTTLQVFEAMDGVLAPCNEAECLLGANSCMDHNCILGLLVSKTHRMFLETLRDTKVTELSESMKLGDLEYGNPQHN
jgi:Rrf2 family nitric oxide-sensitive transcriptional repressor